MTLQSWFAGVRDTDTLSATQRLVAYTLGTLMNDATLQGWATVQTIADCAGLSRRATQYAIVALEDAGLVVVSRSFGREAHAYTLTARDGAYV